MKTRTTCPSCKVEIDLDGEAGKYDLACPKCAHRFNVVVDAAAVAQGSPAANLAYLIEVGGAKSGPHSVEDLLALRQQGRLPDDTKIIYTHEDWSRATTLANSPKLLGELHRLSVQHGQKSQLPGNIGAGGVSGAPPPSGPLIQRRSGWAGALNLLGGFILAIGVIAFMVVADRSGAAAGFTILACCAAGAVQSFFFAFLVDVFTDIRWFLKQLVDKK